jgi:hypothetical protein
VKARELHPHETWRQLTSDDLFGLQGAVPCQPFPDCLSPRHAVGIVQEASQDHVTGVAIDVLAAGISSAIKTVSALTYARLACDTCLALEVPFGPPFLTVIWSGS